VRLTLGSSVSTELAVVIGAVLMLVFVTLAGLRSAAWSSARARRDRRPRCAPAGQRGAQVVEMNDF
jgi:hypothetical protein